MARETPEGEPTELVLGSAWSWDVYYADFPSDESWQLRYYLRGPDDFDLTFGTHVTAESGGSGFEVRVTAAQVAAACTVAGPYRLIGRVNKTGDEFDGTIVYDGHVLMKSDPATAVNAKSFNRRRLDALQDAILTAGADGVLYREVSVNGRRVVIDADAYERELARVTMLVAHEENPDVVVSHVGEFLHG